MYKLLIFAVVALLAVESSAQNGQPVAAPIQNVPVTVSKSSEAAPTSTIKPTTAASTSTTAAKSTPSLELARCRRDCIVTSEYNPVCGCNNVVYFNPGRLICAQDCGVDVTLVNYGLCQKN